MAAAMHSAAMGQLGPPSWNLSPTEIEAGPGGDEDLAESWEKVEIVALDEESSRRAAQILQERRLQRHPMRAYGRCVVQQCNEPGDDDDTPKKQPKIETPLVRITKQLMPVFTWLPKVTRQSLRHDVIAGVTVGLLAIPQSMSYANVAGLKYIYGLYSACVPSLVYAFFGQSRQLSLGPVALVSLLIEAGLRDQLTEEQCPEWYAGNRSVEQSSLESCADEYAKLAILTSFAVGFIQVLASIMKLGFMISFLGHPVTSGFTSGAAILIALGQLKYMLGFDIPKSKYVYEMIYRTAKHLDQTEGMTLLLSICFLTFLVVNKRFSQKYKRLALLGPFGPLVACAVGTLLLALCTPLRDEFHVEYVKEIPQGMMPVSIDHLDYGALPKVLPTAMTASLIGYMASIAIGKTLGSTHHYDVDDRQELFALGLANLIGSAFSCYPVTGSFSRSAVNNSMGACTPLSGLVTALVMLCTIMFLTPLFYYLPKSALAAVVINSVIPLVAIGEARRLSRIKKNDFVLWIVAFIGTLFLGVLQGLAVAVGLSLVIIIYESVRPQITILWRIPGTTIYRNVKQESSGAFIPNVFICRIGSSMYFANASFVKESLLTYVSDLSQVNPVEYLVLEMTSVVSIDTTAVHIIQDIVNDFRSRHIQVAFAMVGNRVEKTMRRAELKSFIGQQWFFPTVNDAVHHCLRHQHAKQKRLAKLKKVMSESPTGQPEGIYRSLTPGTLDVKDTVVQVATEIGFSNGMHHAWTAIFINLALDVSGIVSDIAIVFKRHNISIVRAQIEPLNVSGRKHIYFVKSIRKDSKLTDHEISEVQEDIRAIIHDSTGVEVDTQKDETPSSRGLGSEANVSAGNFARCPTPFEQVLNAQAHDPSKSPNMQPCGKTPQSLTLDGIERSLPSFCLDEEPDPEQGDVWKMAI